MVTTSQARFPMDVSVKIKQIGRTVIGASLLVLFMMLVGLVQMYPGHGEIGNFTYAAAFFVVPIGLWGVVTGIGLMRAWRWSRISMLIFGGLLTFVCAVPALGFLLTSTGGFNLWEAAGMRILGFVFLIPSALVVKWYWYFVGEEARGYFRLGQKLPITSA
jgi:hypothetical protein